MLPDRKDAGECRNHQELNPDSESWVWNIQNYRHSNETRVSFRIQKNTCNLKCKKEGTTYLDMQIVI